MPGPPRLGPSAQSSEVEATTVASPPEVASPIPTGDEQLVGVFRITDVEVGPDVRGAIFTAYVLMAGNQVGAATGAVAPLPPGETAVTFGGLTDFSDQFDQVVFQVDAELGQP